MNHVHCKEEGKKKKKKGENFEKIFVLLLSKLSEKLSVYCVILSYQVTPSVNPKDYIIFWFLSSLRAYKSSRKNLIERYSESGKGFI